MRARLPLFIAALALLVPQVGRAQAEHQHTAPETLGTVAFSTSCSSAAQPRFNRAVALMHSFQFAGAIQGFHGILATEPSCSIAYWGIALSSWGNPFAAGLKTPAQLDAGLRAVQEARAVAPQTERERAYIAAVSHLYSDSATIDQRARTLAYENAMAAVSAAYPTDTEAAIFYALALAAAADPADKTYAKQLKAGAILERLFVQQPNHPGLAHYIIHAYDVPPLAPRAIEAAKRYGEIAPSTSHALHMPSHTFTRVGEWQESIASNKASAAAARIADQASDELHASDYLVYAYLQTGQDSAAQTLVDSAAKTFSGFDPAKATYGAGGPVTAYFARSAIPARFCLERGAWSDAAKLEPLASPYPFTDATTYFARGLGAAHLKDQAGALSAIDSLTATRDRLLKMKETYWANQVDIERQEVSAWLAFAAGDGPRALSEMRTAAVMEDRTEKNAITPGPLAPARELLGELLLNLQQPSDALAAFEGALAKEPNRFRSLYGAAKAARLAGDRARAQTYFSRLLVVAQHADQPGRPELVEARRETQAAASQLSKR